MSTSLDLSVYFEISAMGIPRAFVVTPISRQHDVCELGWNWAKGGPCEGKSSRQVAGWD
jgi:hypothetical protein